MTTNLSVAKEQIESLQAELDEGDYTALERVKDAVLSVIEALDKGEIRVATFIDGQWVTASWIKRAILAYFRLAPMEHMEVGPFTYFDKIPLKRNFAELKVRVVPPAVARFGSFMEPGVVLMPSYTNIGAYIGAGSMIDTWATVGSCAQIGSNVHLSGGVGIGGVLEPAAADPVIIEDGAFIGSRCIIVEGVRIGSDAVLGANVTLTSSTAIIDARGKEFSESRGSIPPRAVVVPGTKEKKLPGGVISVSCAYIIGERKASTDKKTSLNQALRDFTVSV